VLGLSYIRGKKDEENPAEETKASREKGMRRTKRVMEKLQGKVSSPL
jgi:hypothetical protein